MKAETMNFKLAIKVALLIMLEGIHRWLYDEWYVQNKSDNYKKSERYKYPIKSRIKAWIFNKIYKPNIGHEWRDYWHDITEYFQAKSRRYSDCREFYPDRKKWTYY